MEFSNKFKNENIEMKKIYWILGFMTIILGGIYIFGVVTLLGKNEDYIKTKKAKCESDFYAQLAVRKFGRNDSKYKNALTECVKEGNFLMP